MSLAIRIRARPSVGGEVLRIDLASTGVTADNRLQRDGPLGVLGPAGAAPGGGVERVVELLELAIPGELAGTGVPVHAGGQVDPVAAVADPGKGVVALAPDVHHKHGG